MSSLVKSCVWATVVGMAAAVALTGIRGTVQAEDDAAQLPEADVINELLLQRFDENFNEKLDRWEIVAARRRLSDILESGLDPSPVAATDWKEDMMPLFEKLDRDGNRLLDAEEILSARRVLGRLLREAEKDEDMQADEPRPERQRRRPRSSRRPSASGLLGMPGFGGGLPFNPLSFLGSGLGAGGLGAFGSDAGLGGDTGSADWGWSTGSGFNDGGESMEVGEDGGEAMGSFGEEMEGAGPEAGMLESEGAMDELDDMMGGAELGPDEEYRDEMGQGEGPPEDFLGDELAETADAGEGEGEIPMEEGPGDESEEGGKKQGPKPPRPDF